MRATVSTELTAALACPQCQTPVAGSGEYLVCSSCLARYPVLRGIPLMFPSAAQPGPDNVTRLYDSIAGDYDQVLPGHVAEHYLRRRVDLICQFAPSGTVLDVGCGTGGLASRLAGMGYRVAGLDASIGMLDVLARRGNNVMGVAGYGQCLPFLSDSFNIVVTVAALHHIADASKVSATLREMYRVLRPGGALVVWDHNPLNPYWPLLMRRVPQDSGEERLIPRQEIVEALSGAGATVTDALRLGFMPDFMPRPLVGIWSWLEAIAESLPLVRKMAAHNVVVARKS